MSHAERGKSWRGLGLAGIQPNHLRFAPTPFLAGILISFSGGSFYLKFELGLRRILKKVESLCDAVSFGRNLKKGEGVTEDWECEGKDSVTPSLFVFLACLGGWEVCSFGSGK